MILLLTPTRIESRHLIFPYSVDHIICGIGENAKNIESLLKTKTEIDLVILFGCCGLIRYDMPLGKLYVAKNWYYYGEYEKIDNDTIFSIKDLVWIDRGITVDYSIHQPERRRKILDYQIVDQESFHIVRLCHEYGLPVCVIRYGEDYCDRKMIPVPGINHFYHYWNHWNMQRKMSNVLKLINDKLYAWMENEH